MSPQLALLVLAVSSSFVGQVIIERTDDKAPSKPGIEYSTRKDLYGDPLPRGVLARLGSVRFHSPTGITALAFSADGKEIMVYGMPSQALSFRFWETATGKELFHFECEDKGTIRHVRQAILSPDNKTVGLCRGGSIDLFDRQTGKRRRTIAMTTKSWEADIISFAISPDGKHLVAGCMEWKDDNPIRVWEIDTGKQLEPFKGKGVSLHALTFSADGKKLFSAPTGGSFTQANKTSPIPASVCVWETSTRKLLCEIRHDNSNVAFAGRADRIALEGGKRQAVMFSAQIGGGPPGPRPKPKEKELPPSPFAEPGIHIVSASTGKAICLLPVRQASFALTPDGKALVSLDDSKGLRLWDASTGMELRRFSGRVPHESQLAGISPDGKVVAVLAGSWRGERSVRLWSVATGKEIRPFAGHRDEVTHLAFSRDGKLLASGSRDQTVRLWDPTTGKELRRLTGHKAAVLAVAFSPDARVLASASADGVTRLWAVDAGRLLAEFQHPPGHKDEWGIRRPGEGVALAFTKDGKSLHAVGRDGMVATWDVAARKEARRTILHAEKTVISTPPVILPDLSAALTANSDEWRTESPETLNVWDLKAAKMTQAVPLRDKLPDYTHIDCSAVACSPDGRLFVSSQKLVTHSLRTQYMDPSLRVFERLTGMEILRVKEVLSQALAFSPDGKVLAADIGGASTWGNIGVYGFGTTIGLWDTLTGDRYATLSGHWSPVRCLAFSPDRKTFASGSADHSILVWEVPPLKQPAATGAPTPKQMQGWWEDLAAPDARQAHQAMAQLVRHPTHTIELLGAKLSAAVAPDRRQVAAWIADLDSTSFATRDAAYKKLAALDDLAEPMLRRALARGLSLETRSRIERLLSPGAISPRQLRSVRAVGLLERIGRPEAFRIVERLARGVPEARLTREARAAMGRSGK